jgi:cytochrome bd-type quinol oxidase subunit 2
LRHIGSALLSFIFSRSFPAVFSGLTKELRQQAATVASTIRTREFWIYLAVVLVLVGMAAGVVYLAIGFDPLTRAQLRMAISCRTGESQIGTIIAGLFVFGLACVFTLGEVVHWVEEKRMSRAPGRQKIKLSYWRPILHVAGTLALGVTGYVLMSAWCS